MIKSQFNSPMYFANSEPVNSVSSRSCKLELLIVLLFALSILGWLWNRGGRALATSGFGSGLVTTFCCSENNSLVPSLILSASIPVEQIFNLKSYFVFDRCITNYVFEIKGASISNIFDNFNDF